MTTGQKMFLRFISISAIGLILGAIPKNHVIIAVIVLALIALIYNVLKYINERLRQKDENVQ